MVIFAFLLLLRSKIFPDLLSFGFSKSGGENRHPRLAQDVKHTAKTPASWRKIFLGGASMDYQKLSFELLMRAMTIYEHDKPEKSGEVKKAQNVMGRALEHLFQKRLISSTVPQSFRQMRTAETKEKRRKKMGKTIEISLEICEPEYLKKNQRFFSLLETVSHVSILQDCQETNWYSLLKVGSGQDSEVIPVPVFLDMAEENTTEGEDNYHQTLVDFLNRHEISFWVKDKHDPENWDGQIILDRDHFLTKTLDEDRTEWLQERIVTEEILEDGDFCRLCAVSERVPQELKAANVKEQEQIINEFMEALLQHEAAYLQHETVADGKVATLLHIDGAFTNLTEYFRDQIIKKGVIGPYGIVPWGKFEEVSHCRFESASEDYGKRLEINDEFTPVLIDQAGNQFFTVNSYTWDTSEHLKGFGYGKTMIEVGGKRLLAASIENSYFVVVIGTSPFTPVQGDPKKEETVRFDVDEDLRRNQCRSESKSFKTNGKDVTKDRVFVQDDLFRRMLIKFPGLLEDRDLAYRYYDQYQEVNVSSGQISNFRERITKLAVGNMHWRPRTAKYESEAKISDEISIFGENNPKDTEVVIGINFGGFLKETVHVDWYRGECWWDYDSTMRDEHERWQIKRYRNSLHQATLAFVSFGIEVPETEVPDIMWKDRDLHRETVDLLNRDRTFYPYHGIAASMRGAYAGWHKVLDKFGQDEAMKVFQNLDLFDRDPDLLINGLYGTAEKHVNKFGDCDRRIAEPFFSRLNLTADEKAEIIRTIDGHEKIRKSIVSGLAECLGVDYSFDGDLQWNGSVDKIIRV